MTDGKIELYRRRALAFIRDGQLENAITDIESHLKPEINQFIRLRKPTERSASLLRTQVELLEAEILLARRRPADA